MRKCDKDGRDCGVCKDACVLTTDAPPPALPRLYAPRPAVIRQCPVSGDACNDCSAWQCQRIPADAVAAALDTDNPKDIAGRAKPQMGLIPAAAMEAIARVMELGAKKYGPYNWRAQPIKNMVYANAALRHLYAFIGGQTTDPESGQSHLAHVASCMAIVLDAEASGTCIEDRSWLPGDKP